MTYSNTCLSIRRTLFVKISSAISFAEPKLLELVPTLTDQSNFAPWSSALKCALGFRNPANSSQLTHAVNTRLQLPLPPTSPLQPILFLETPLYTTTTSSTTRFASSSGYTRTQVDGSMFVRCVRFLNHFLSFCSLASLTINQPHIAPCTPTSTPTSPNNNKMQSRLYSWVRLNKRSMTQLFSPKKSA